MNDQELVNAIAKEFRNSGVKVSNKTVIALAFALSKESIEFDSLSVSACVIGYLVAKGKI